MSGNRKRRRIRPDKIAAAVLGGGGFYQRLPAPEKITCSRCGEERNSVGQDDGVCLKCRWNEKKAAREVSGRAGTAMEKDPSPPLHGPEIGSHIETSKAVDSEEVPFPE